jgi:hypothetical protein
MRSRNIFWFKKKRLLDGFGFLFGEHDDDCEGEGESNEGERFEGSSSDSTFEDYIDDQ